jgi:murein L,D-transpeptidase YafK
MRDNFTHRSLTKMPAWRDWKMALLVLLLGLLSVPSQAAGGVHVVVDTGAGTLRVFDGERVVATFDDISIGRFGVTGDKRRGDNKTPLGHFRIGWIARRTHYHRFLGLTYPNLEIASKAFANGLIDKKDWLAIRHAEKTGDVPPQHTPLGGMIGIHGLGKGDPDVHQRYNWTNGCVALTNEEIDRLMSWVHIGTPIEIR